MYASAWKTGGFRSAMISRKTLSIGNGYAEIPQPPTPAATIRATSGRARSIVRSMRPVLFLCSRPRHEVDRAPRSQGWRGRQFSVWRVNTKPNHRTRDTGLRMVRSPAHKLLVFGEDGVDQLVQHVLRRLADHVCVRVQGLVVLLIQPRTVLDESLTTGAGFDDRHNHSFQDRCVRRSPGHARGTRPTGHDARAPSRDLWWARSRARLSGQTGQAAGA